MSATDILLALINADNPNRRPIKKESVTFSAPVAVAGEGWNTKVTVRSVPGKGYEGDVDVTYHRVELTELGHAALLSDAQFTPEMVIELINELKGTLLTLDDVEPFTVPVLDVGEFREVKLTIKSDSFGWTGEAYVEILFGLPTLINELHQLVTFTMPSNGYLTR